MNEVRATINLSAIGHNLKIVKELAPNSKIVAIVKANAYGHGTQQIAQAASTLSDAFGVARLEEAIALRKIEKTKPIILLEGIFCEEDVPLLYKYNLETVVHSKEQLEALEANPLNTSINVWLKLDTGMHRLGIVGSEAVEYYQRLSQIKNIKKINIVSHFSHADHKNDQYTELQLNTFESITQQLASMISEIKLGTKPIIERSIAASSGILYHSNSHYEWVRPGIMMYGISPNNDYIGHDYDLKPVMSLRSKLISVRVHKKGEAVGYGGKWVSSQDTMLGVVAMGYGDGYPRDVPTGTPVFINGRLVPIVGNVSMDMITVDLGTEGQDKVGDEAEFWGENLPIEHVAKIIGVISYELVTKTAPRVLFDYVSYE